MPASHRLYHKTMGQLLPVVQHPAYEAALLMRLLAEEGVIGEMFERIPGQLSMAAPGWLCNGMVNGSGCSSEDRQAAAAVIQYVALLTG